VEARDGVRDLSILCGAGSDALIRDRLDPVGVSC
jgi:hypothetical protein